MIIKWLKTFQYSIEQYSIEKPIIELPVLVQKVQAIATVMFLKDLCDIHTGPYLFILQVSYCLFIIK